jgi:hypothetical protein
MITTIPACLTWKPVNGSLTWLRSSDFGRQEHFSLWFNESAPEGYQWRLTIHRDEPGQESSCFLHGHLTREDAVAAARLHLGMD